MHTEQYDNTTRQGRPHRDQPLLPKAVLVFNPRAPQILFHTEVVLRLESESELEHLAELPSGSF